MAVPTSSVSTFNDAVTDTNLTNNIPLLNKNGTFDGRLAGDTATTVGSDGFDIFVIDVSGGTHDSAGSLTSSDTLTISYQLDGPGSISIGEGLARYSDLNSGLGPSGGGNHSPLSGSGTFTVNASHWTPAATSPGDYAYAIRISAFTSPGTSDYRGTYHLSFSIGGGGGGGGVDSNSQFINGTAGDDTLVGGSGNDIISGFSGNDIVFGNEGSDDIGGGPGNDKLYGGEGNDRISGEAGTDFLDGGAGADTLNGGTDSDLYVYSPGYGFDTIYFVPHAFTQDPAPDLIDFRGFRNVHSFSEFSAHLYSRPSTATESYDFGNGDRITITSDQYNIAGFLRADDFLFYPAPQTIIGGTNNDSLIGGPGDDTIGGGVGNDTLVGQDGDDTIGGDSGDDHINAGAGNDVIFGGAGNDELGGGSGDDTIVGQDGIDVIFGEEGNDVANGGAGADIMVGGPGNDTFGGGADNDAIVGGDGNDLLFGEDGIDNINGGPGDDGVVGGPGDDILGGGDGNDIVVGDDGNDVLFGEAGNDSMNGGFGNDILIGSDGDDVLGGGAGDDDINGGFGNDTLFGENGNDVLNGSAGNDILIGGGNDDTFVFQPGDGADTIGDFFAGGPEDRIWFKGTDLHSFADVQSHAATVAGNTVITYNGFFTVTLNGVAAGQLTAGDFIFT